MNYVNLGSAGLEVSAICLGCMSFGDPSCPSYEWSLDEEASRPILRQALEAGITFWDTANAYSDGASEEIVGRALRQLTTRENVQLATKVWGPMRTGPNSSGLSRKSILREIDASLQRLQTDYVDLYQIHRFDSQTPLEETLEAMHDVVKAGKARYIGASSMWAWQFAKALFIAQRHGWTRFVSMQNHYNLIYREEEREMLALCADQRIAVIPWSPLARGRLAREWNTTTARSERDDWGSALYTNEDRHIIDRVEVIAAHRGIPRAQVALAWLMSKPVVTAPIVGATEPDHLADAIAATEIRLTDDEIARLEEPYRPHEVVGHE